MCHHCRKIQTTNMCEDSKTPNACKRTGFCVSLPSFTKTPPGEPGAVACRQPCPPGATDPSQLLPEKEDSRCAWCWEVLGAQSGQQGRVGPWELHRGSGGVGEGYPRARALGGKGAGERASPSAAQFWNMWYG